jgi:beta-lactamase class A
MQELAKRLNAMCDEKPFSTWWYVKDLRTGESANRNGDEVVISASTRKVVIMMAALKKVNDGEISLDDPFEIEAAYQGNTSGCFQHFRPGIKITWYDAILMMIIMSDNTCTGKIWNTLGIDYLNEYTRGIGMVGTTHRPRVEPEDLPQDHPITAKDNTTANDQGLLLELIVTGTKDPEAAKKLGVTPELCEIAIDIMKKQKLVTKLPALLPKAASVAHKTGSARRNANDVGIIFENDEPRYVFCVYIDGTSRGLRTGPTGQTACAKHIATMCRECWDAIVA